MGACEGQNVLVTGASMGIGSAIAKRLAEEGAASLILFARSADKLEELARALPKIRVLCRSVDLQDHGQVEQGVRWAREQLGGKTIDVLMNNAGLAVGAPAIFPDLSPAQIAMMVNTNIGGLLSTTYAVLNAGGMRENGHGTILNITSVTGLEVPPFPGEAVYHTAKAAQEAFTNALRVELVGSNIKVLALRPGVVATHFHQQRVGFDKNAYDSFIEGYEPLVADDIAEAAAYMLGQKERVSIKALDVVPTAQRSLASFDRDWNSRQ